MDGGCTVSTLADGASVVTVNVDRDYVVPAYVERLSQHTQEQSSEAASSLVFVDRSCVVLVYFEIQHRAGNLFANKTSDIRASSSSTSIPGAGESTIDRSVLA